MRFPKYFARLFAWVGLAVLAFALVALWVPAMPARASGDIVSLSLNNSADNFTYGYDPTPSFNVQITLAQPYTTQHWDGGVVVQIDNGSQQFSFSSLNYGSLVSSSLQGATYTINLPKEGIPPGTDPATVTFTNAETGVTTTSNTLEISMQQATVELGCWLGPQSQPKYYMPGASIQVLVGASGALSDKPIDWTQGTLDLDLTQGSNAYGHELKLDSNGQATINLPSQIGSYQISCYYSDTEYYHFSPMRSSSETINIGQTNPVTIHIYTNPTTVVYNQSFQLYIVFQGASGLPKPTGTYSVDLRHGKTIYLHDGQYTMPTSAAPLMNISLPATITSWDTIAINYSGDEHYASQTATFSLTNPAIPGSSGNGSGNSGGSSGSTKSSGTTTPGSNISGSNSTGSSQNSNSTSSAASAADSGFGGWLIALLAFVALLLVGGGVGTYIMLARRRGASAAQRASTPVAPTVTTSPPDWHQPPSQPPYQG